MAFRALHDEAFWLAIPLNEAAGLWPSIGDKQGGMRASRPRANL